MVTESSNKSTDLVLYRFARSASLSRKLLGIPALGSSKPQLIFHQGNFVVVVVVGGVVDNIWFLVSLVTMKSSPLPSIRGGILSLSSVKGGKLDG